MPGVPSVPAIHQELVVGRFDVANMGNHRQTSGLLVQGLGGGGATDATAVFGARMFGNSGCRRGGAPRIEPANPLGELLDVGAV